MRNHLGQVENLALHAVNALHHNQNLGPRPARARLASGNGLAHHLFQMSHVVVAKRGDLGRTALAAGNQRGVVQRVADNQPSLAHQTRQHRRVGLKAHSKHHGRLLAHKARHGALQLVVHVGGAKLGPRSANTYAVALQRTLHVLSDPLVAVGKAQIVVAAQIQTATRRTSPCQRLVVHAGRKRTSLLHQNVCSGLGSNRPVPAVANPRK